MRSVTFIAAGLALAVLTACGTEVVSDVDADRASEDQAGEPVEDDARFEGNGSAGSAPADDDADSGDAGDDAGDARATDSTAGTGRDGGPPAAVEALDVEARVLGGGQVDLASFAGDPVALWMWAPW